MTVGGVADGGAVTVNVGVNVIVGVKVIVGEAEGVKVGRGVGVGASGPSMSSAAPRSLATDTGSLTTGGAPR